MKPFASSARLRGPFTRRGTSPSLDQLELQRIITLSQQSAFCIVTDQQYAETYCAARNAMSGVEEPLLLPRANSSTVTCNGVKGTLSIDKDGGISYKPLETRTVIWCSLCKGKNVEPQISGWHVVGAALDSPNSFRVWYFTPARPITKSSSSSSTGPSPRFKLHKTLPFVCASGSEATALVQTVRQAAAWHGRQAPPQVVAVINPSSGQGRAEKVFEQQVLPVLQDAAGMTVCSMVTTGPGAATELMAQLDLTAVDLLLFVGGDGTVYEGLQGLLSRPDWESARRVPIAHVPGGSGNGLAHSCGLPDAHTAAFAICKAVVSPMDMASVLQPPASRQFIMLSVAYGTLANLDINTERFRWMGDVRFTLGAIWETLKGDKYNASIAWLPADAEQQPDALLPHKPVQPTATSSSYSKAEAAADSSSSSSSVVIDSTTLQDAGAAVSSTAESSSMPAQLPVSCTRVASILVPQPERFAGPSVSLQDFPAQGPELPLLQQLGRLPLNVPSQDAASSLLPPGWRVWHEPLELFACINPPYISATSKMNPAGSLHSGHFNMLMYEGLPGFIGRLQALLFLAKSATGAHLDAPSLIQEKVRAMIFAPRDYGTYLELDGEMIPHVPIYMEVHPGLLQVVISPAHPCEPAADHSRHQYVRTPPQQ